MIAYLRPPPLCPIWEIVLQQFASGSEPPLYAELLKRTRHRENIQQMPSREPKLLQRILEAPPVKRHGLLLDQVKQEAFKVLALDPSYSMDPQQPLREMGLDSLMAVQLRNSLGKALERTLPATVVFDYPSIQALTDFLFGEVFPSRGPDKLRGAMQKEGLGGGNASEELEKLTQEEIAALLAKKIAGFHMGAD